MKRLSPQSLAIFMGAFALLLAQTACRYGDALPFEPVPATATPLARQQIEAANPPGIAYPPGTEPTPAPTATSAPFFGQGEVVPAGQLNFYVLGWDEIPETNEIKAGAGHKLIYVDMIVVNAGSEAANFYDDQIALEDSSGFPYEPESDLSVLINAGSFYGELAPGEKLRGKLGYRIYQRATGLILLIRPEVNAPRAAVIQLAPQAGIETPPALIPGETAIPVTQKNTEALIEDLAVRVNGTTTETNHPFFSPREGFTYLLVDVSIENRGTQAKNITSLFQFSIKTDQGIRYTSSLLAPIAGEVDDEDLNGEVAPGKTLRGWLGYEVPLDASGLVLVFDPGIITPGKVFLELP